MKVHKTIKLRLRDKDFLISFSFRYYDDIDQKIYQQLMIQHNYQVISNVNDNIFQSFINYWINKEIPEINFSNYSEYFQLSCEFDIMKDLLELYKKHFLQSSISSLIVKNQELKKQNQDKKAILNSNIEKYKQIINFLFMNNETATESIHFKGNNELYKACEKENLKDIDLLTRKKFKQNDFTYILNEKSDTAEIFHCFQTKNKIVIPRSVSYKSKEYTITSIIEKSFNFQNRVRSVKFADYSELKIIDNSAFYMSSIEKIVIPSHVTHILNKAFSYCSKLRKIEVSENSELTSIGELALSNSTIEKLSIPSSIVEFKEGWCNSTFNLTQIKIFFNKIQNIQYFEGKFIVGKSDQKSDIFDLLLFSRRDLKTVTIPSFIKRISPYAFDKCYHLTTVNFLNDSNLQYIDKNAFSETSIVNISIPKHVIQIDEAAFYFCEKLVNIEFHENSELKKICLHAFYQTSIESIAIPSSVVELEDGWCSFTPSLNNIKIMPNNKHFVYFENNFILSEFLTFSRCFDVLLFARRTIKNVIIPSFIKRIASYSFCHCDCLQKIEFESNSQLDSIGERAFYFSSVKKISIPSQLRKIESFAFGSCKCLKQVQIPDDAELESIGEFAFAFSIIDCFYFSSNLKRIDIKAFYYCTNLKIIEIDEKSKLHSIDKNVFDSSSLKIIMIPKTLKIIFNF